MATVEHVTAVKHLWPLLLVGDINRSVEFYETKLGFSVVGRAEAGGRLFWCRLARGGASIMLQEISEEDGDVRDRGRGVTFFFVCDDAELLNAEFSLRGLALAGPAVAEYGMKQLFVPEPDGYSICFESPVEN